MHFHIFVLELRSPSSKPISWLFFPGLAEALDVKIFHNDRISFGVGGLLAHHNYAYRGCTDLTYLD